MYIKLLISTVLINFINAGEHFGTKNGNENKALLDTSALTNTARMKWSPGYHLWKEYFAKPHKGTPYNLTYMEREDNLIRMPVMNKNQETIKKKTYKKSPKRTIQKIIKSKKSKLKKLYVVRMPSSHPTMATKFDYNDRVENSRKAEVTTRSNEKKILKKYNMRKVKIPRYPLPYHSMQLRKNNYMRPKRETRDIFILQDFDSMKFLKGKSDVNVVNAHFKKYW